MGIPLQRFDMSEYMERHSVSRLIGAPPGLCRLRPGRLLTDAVDQHPHSVLLLDEIEKAHPDLFNILLQVMDNGKLTDHHGKTVDFRNTVLIMTTNAGASDMARESIGFGAASREDAQEDAVKKMFTPEFRNRLDAIVPFSYLPPAVVARVVDKFILQLELQLADRNVHIELDDEARSGSPTAATTSSTAPRRWAAWSRRRSSSRSPRTAVRQAGQRRRGQGPDQGQRARVRDHARAAKGHQGQGRQAQGRSSLRNRRGARAPNRRALLAPPRRSRSA
jgi:MoxR-like ATPase